MNSEAIYIDDSSEEFNIELKRRIKKAKNPKNRKPLSQAKHDILKKYQELAGAKV